MDAKKLALGIATFAGGVAALTVGAIALGHRPVGDDAADASGSGGAEAGSGAGQGAATPQPLATNAADGPAPSYAQATDHPVAGSQGEEGHAAPDLAADAEPGQRAPEAFRPDMDAPMTPAEREALRPAVGPSPTLVDAGTSLPANS